MIIDIATRSDFCSPFYDEQNDVKSESLTQGFTVIFNVKVRYEVYLVTLYKSQSGSRDIALHFL